MNVKRIAKILLLIILFPIAVKANHIGDLTQNISLSLDCEKCFLKDSLSAKFKLFLNGEPVEGQEIVLNKDNNYQGMFENVLIYEDETNTWYYYDVKYLDDDGNYHELEDDEIEYKTAVVDAWRQVQPEDITSGHNYVLFTDNWNYENNNRDRHILISGDMGHVYTEAIPFYTYSYSDYIESYYILIEDPPEEAVWHFTKNESVPPLNDTNDSSESNYWELTSFEDKHLVLAGYETVPLYTYIFKQSSRNGYQESEKAMYNNVMEIIPSEKGRFIITSYVPWAEDHNTRMYLGIGHYVEVKAQREEEYAAHIMAFEKIENEEVELLDMVITKKMCTGDETEITLKVNSSKSLTTIFDDMDDLDLVRDCVIEDETIAKIEDGQIIPLAVGKTDIIVNYRDNQYRIILNVTEDDLINNDTPPSEEPIENPDTGTIAPIGISVIVAAAGIINFINVRRKKYFIQ